MGLSARGDAFIRDTSYWKTSRSRPPLTILVDTNRKRFMEQTNDKINLFEAVNAKERILACKNVSSVIHLIVCDSVGYPRACVGQWG